MTAYNLLICLVVLIYYKVNSLPCAMEEFLRIYFSVFSRFFSEKKTKKKQNIDFNKLPWDGLSGC